MSRNRFKIFGLLQFYINGLVHSIFLINYITYSKHFVYQFSYSALMYRTYQTQVQVHQPTSTRLALTCESMSVCGLWVCQCVCLCSNRNNEWACACNRWIDKKREGGKERDIKCQSVHEKRNCRVCFPNSDLFQPDFLRTCFTDHKHKHTHTHTLIRLHYIKAIHTVYRMLLMLYCISMIIYYQSPEGLIKIYLISCNHFKLFHQNRKEFLFILKLVSWPALIVY